MTVMTVASQRGQYLERASGGGLADVIDTILDKGLVIDVFARVSLVGIEILTVDARVVVASVDTYLRFAERANRLDIARSGTQTRGLPGLMEEVREGGAKSKTKGVLEGAKEKVGDFLQGSGDSAGSRREPERSRHSGHSGSRREWQEDDQ